MATCIIPYYNNRICITYIVAIEAGGYVWFGDIGCWIWGLLLEVGERESKFLKLKINDVINIFDEQLIEAIFII